jgi:signal transduction histidine kinase
MHAEKIAQVERAKQEFVSIAAHQLRAPVSAIMTASMTLNDFDSKNLSGAQNQLLGMIVKGVERMNGLVDFLLQMTRAETGSMILAPTPVNLKQLTNELVQELESSRKQKSIKIKIHQKPSNIPPVLVDKNALTQVILNLLSNAIDYSPEGSQIVASIVLNDGQVEFSVKDEGIGISSEDQGKIFDKFYRSGKAKEVAQAGTGLGLPLAKSIVDSWGGRIRVDSEENKGSTFYFTIPIAPEDAAELNEIVEPVKNSP